MQNSDQTEKVQEAVGRGRGRPRAFNRTAALEVATRLFWLRGYEATSISDLTEAMGIGSPSLYAAFGSKDALYAEAVRFYVDTYEGLVWDKFKAAATARQAIQGYLLDSASALTGTPLGNPPGCMVALSSVGSEGHRDLGELVRSERAGAFSRLKARLEQAIEQGEIPAVEVGSLARFVQGVQYGMSILARDGVSCAELSAAAEIAMKGYDAHIGQAA